MRRFLLLSFILFVITAGLFLFSGSHDAAKLGPNQETVESGYTDGQPYFILYRAMELAEARVQYGELHYWASLDYEKPLTAGEMELEADALLERLAPRFVPAHAFTRVEKNDLPLAPAAYDESDTDPDFILVEREGELYQGGRIRFMLQGMEEAGERTVHLFITIYEEGEARRLGDLARRLPSQLDLNTLNSSLTLSLQGSIPIVMERDQMEQLAIKIAGKLGAREVESIHEEFMVSVTGSTPLLKAVSGSASLPVNLNLALRNDTCTDCTTFWIGTPLISGMY